MSTETAASPDRGATGATIEDAEPATRPGRRFPALALPALPAVEWVGLVVPMLLLAALALRDIGTYSLWRDEASSVIFAKGSLGDLLTIIGRDRQEVGLANMATYYLILHFWLLIGETEARIRLLSVIFGVLSVVPVFLIGRRLAGWVAGALAAGIFVLIPYVIHYSQEARGYSLAALMGGMLTWLVLVGVERRDRVWPWLAYGIIAALGLYVHFFMALVVAAHGLWLLATRRVPPWRSAAAAVVPFALAAAPLPFIIAEFGGEHGWIPPLNAARAVDGLQKLMGGVAPFILMPVLLAAAAVERWRDARFWLVAMTIVFPIGAAIAISLVKPMFIPRYLIMVLPALAVVAAVAILSLRPAFLRAGVAILIVGILVSGLPRAYFTQTDIDWRAGGRWMAAEIEAGDSVVMTSWRDSPLEYYFLRFEPPAQPVRVSEREALAGEVEGRIWLAMTATLPDAASERIAQYLSRYTVAEARTLGRRAQLVLLVPRADAPAVSDATSLLPSARRIPAQEGT
jgi:mannosyltransferase